MLLACTSSSIRRPVEFGRCSSVDRRVSGFGRRGKMASLWQAIVVMPRTMWKMLQAGSWSSCALLSTSMVRRYFERRPEVFPPCSNDVRRAGGEKPKFFVTRLTLGALPTPGGIVTPQMARVRPQDGHGCTGMRTTSSTGEPSTPGVRRQVALFTRRIFDRWR